MLTSPRHLRALDRFRPRLASLVRYASVSVVSTTVGLTTLALLVEVGHWSAGWANVAATALGTIPSFELNRRWVWRLDERRSFWREVVPFVTLCLIELVASTEAVRAAAGWTQHAGWSREVRTLGDLAANLTTYGVLWIVQYLVLDRLLFARGHARKDDRGGRPVGPDPGAAAVAVEWRDGGALVQHGAGDSSR